jgi:hypothetical protein
MIAVLNFNVEYQYLSFLPFLKLISATQGQDIIAHWRYDKSGKSTFNLHAWGRLLWILKKLLLSYNNRVYKILTD